ncbi:MAG: response regulator [Desulfoprunum sp.]|nr:response regulator [Desulfoprunum sp.]
MVELLSQKDAQSALPALQLLNPGESVVIVDDSPEIVVLLNHYLTKQGFTVLQAGSAGELYKHLEGEHVALVLLDIGLPDRNGTEILLDLVSKYPDLGIIMVTGSIDLQTALDCLRQGADDYLTKPVSMEQFNHTIRNTLKKRRLAIDNRLFQRELEAKNYRAQFLHQLNQKMNSAYLSTVELTGILQAILVGITSEEGLQFNRAFLALFDESGDHLQGRLAIGPSSREDAGRVWNAIKESDLHFQDIITHLRTDYRDKDIEVNRIVQSLRIPTAENEHILIQAALQRTSIIVNQGWAGNHPVTGQLLELLAEDSFVIVPLYSPSKSLGVIIVDNFITGKPISTEDVHSLEIFASQASLAIEHSHLYEDMLNKIAELEIVTQELERSKDLLVEAEKYSAMGQMSAQLVHAIRNPITSIGGTARLLAKKSDDPYTISFLNVITKEAAKIEATLEDLFSFVQDGEINIVEQPLYPILRRSVMVFYTTMKKNKISYTLDLPEQDPVIPVDGVRIRQAFLHLIRNAIEAMPEGGTLRVTAASHEDNVHITISDTGLGIPEAALRRVTDPFYTTKVYGTGMGLTLVERILAMHNGSFHLKPADDGGMIAIIILPRRLSSLPQA